MNAGIYARISKDRAGEGLGVQRQQSACETKAKALGWAIVDTYTDNDVSSSRGDKRPEYERLVSDLKAGRIKAVVVYDLDRLTRRPAELEEFMSVADQHGISLANVSGDVDLTTANGQMIARIKGAVAAQEARRISERTAAQKAQRAALGKPMGTRYRVFGYNRDWTVNEEEAAVVRDVFRRYIAGESQNSLTRSLINEGRNTTANKPWTLRATSRLLQDASYAGIYMFKGVRTGKTNYPALIDEATFEAANVNRVKGERTARRYLLSGILICDECKAPMTGAFSKQKGGERYRCSVANGGCGQLSIKASFIDDMVNAYMSHIVLIEDAQRPAPVEDNRLDDIDAKIAQIQQDADMDLTDQVALLKTYRAKRKEILKEQAEATVEASQPIADYDAADLSVKRAEIRRYIKYLIVKKVDKSIKQTAGNAHERIRVVWSDRQKENLQRFNANFKGVSPGIAIASTDLRDRAEFK